MKRTQIYLLETQNEELNKLAVQKGKALSEVIREAVNLYLVENKANQKDIISETSGIWKERQDINSDEYLDALRKDINTRMEDELF